MKATGNLILDKSFVFALDIIEFADQLESKKKYAIANQLLKSGTSVGANIREAQSPESKADFIHKMKIAAKEAEETQYWLLLVNMRKACPIRENWRIKSLKSRKSFPPYYLQAKSVRNFGRLI